MDRPSPTIPLSQLGSHQQPWLTQRNCGLFLSWVLGPPLLHGPHASGPTLSHDSNIRVIIKMHVPPSKAVSIPRICRYHDLGDPGFSCRHPWGHPKRPSLRQAAMPLQSVLQGVGSRKSSSLDETCFFPASVLPFFSSNLPSSNAMSLVGFSNLAS